MDKNPDMAARFKGAKRHWRPTRNLHSRDSSTVAHSTNGDQLARSLSIATDEPDMKRRRVGNTQESSFCRTSSPPTPEDPICVEEVVFMDDDVTSSPSVPYSLPPVLAASAAAGDLQLQPDDLPRPTRPLPELMGCLRLEESDAAPFRSRCYHEPSSYIVVATVVDAREATTKNKD